MTLPLGTVSSFRELREFVRSNEMDASLSADELSDECRCEERSSVSRFVTYCSSSGTTVVVTGPLERRVRAAIRSGVERLRFMDADAAGSVCTTPFDLL